MAGLVKGGSVISIIIILAAYYYKRQSDEALQQHLQEVLSGLLRAEKKVSLPEQPKVAVGFGACQDIFSDAMEVLDKLGATPPEDPKHFNQITSMEDLERGFAYFFRHGAAAERYVRNESLFDELVAAASGLDTSRWALGGNAPVMAHRFHMEGCKVLLGAVTSPQLRQQIDDGIEVAGGSLKVDDIHLLLEYHRGDSWGDLQAPRANRYIVHSDNNNPFITSLEEFVKELKTFSPSLLVIGGLQMLDNFPFKEGERHKRLGEVKSTLATLPQKTRVHFEMASFAEEECLKDTLHNIVRYSDSLGMNEQELPNLHSILTNGSVTLISDPYPRIATTLDHMRAVYELLQETDAPGQRPLTRLHVHTLAYQAIMTTKGSSWKHSMSAAAKSSLVANRHTCGSPKIDAAKARLLMDDSFTTSRDTENGERIPLDPRRPVACWEERVANTQVEICIAPVLVCTEVVQTGGGGDNISSAGLVLQI